VAIHKEGYSSLAELDFWQNRETEIRDLLALFTEVKFKAVFFPYKGEYKQKDIDIIVEKFAKVPLYYEAKRKSYCWSSKKFFLTCLTCLHCKHVTEMYYGDFDGGLWAREDLCFDSRRNLMVNRCIHHEEGEKLDVTNPRGLEDPWIIRLREKRERELHPPPV
jgi:hypothetical protein